MQNITDIYLDGAVGLMAIVALLYLTLRGRIEICIAILLVVNQWTRTVFFFGIPHVYVLGGCIIVTAMLMLPRRLSITSPVRNHRWIIPWLMAWWFWQGIINLVYPSEGYSFRLFLINIALVVPLLWLYVGDVGRVRSFALAYLVTTVVGGILAFSTTLGDQFWRYLLADPLLNQAGAFRYVSYNYNFWAAPFAVSIVLAWTLAREAKRRWQQMALIMGMIFCCYMVVIISSRQHVAGALFALIVIAWMSLLALRRDNQIRFVPLVAVVGIVVLGVVVYGTTPGVILRAEQGEYTMRDAFTLLGTRPEIWAEMWEVFLTSPLFGSGLDYNAHHLFLGTLVTQGLVGFVFLGGWLVFALQILRYSFRVTVDHVVQQWQWCMLLIAGMALVTGQFSGDATSLWYLFWPVIIAWNLQSNAEIGAVALEKRSPGLSPAKTSSKSFGSRG